MSSEKVTTAATATTPTKTLKKGVPPVDELESTKPVTTTVISKSPKTPSKSKQNVSVEVSESEGEEPTVSKGSKLKAGKGVKTVFGRGAKGYLEKVVEKTDVDTAGSVTEEPEGGKKPVVTSGKGGAKKGKGGGSAKREKIEEPEGEAGDSASLEAGSVGGVAKRKRSGSVTKEPIAKKPKVEKPNGEKPKPEKPKVEKPKIPHIVVSQRSQADMEKIIKKIGDAVFQQNVDGNTTHLVVGETGRTLKVLTALSLGLFILKDSWLTSSLEKKKWVKETPFECVDWFFGCRKSRLAHEKGEDLLFTEKRIHVGPNQTKVPKENLEDFVVNNGGKIHFTPTGSHYTIAGKRAPIISEDLSSDPTTEGPTEVVQVEWLLDSLSNYEIADPKDYPVETPKERNKIMPPKKPRGTSKSRVGKEGSEAGGKAEEDGKEIPKKTPASTKKGTKTRQVVSSKGKKDKEETAVKPSEKGHVVEGKKKISATGEKKTSASEKESLEKTNSEEKIPRSVEKKSGVGLEKRVVREVVEMSEEEIEGSVGMSESMGGGSGGSMILSDQESEELGESDDAKPSLESTKSDVFLED
eukprot:TRINITY_DN4090_c0_g1_i1.p1 TRINITY_DN4090_c0_g1~~TRINITY_DN4090_c0_g1_i1.p1  ORF type:complete len:581 (-),score=183.63 TRINITY_DN4090_c0_g1_i1:142-1884(-)